MMSRTQISLNQEMVKHARRRASQVGISLAEYIRRLLARDLQESRPPAGASAAFDVGSSGGSDIAREGDAAIAAAISSEQDRLGRRSGGANRRRSRKDRAR